MKSSGVMKETENIKYKKKTTEIKCLICDSIEEYHFYITIYNSSNEIVYKSYVSSKEVINFEVPYVDEYKFEIKPEEKIFPLKICQKFKLVPCLFLCIYFNFYKYCVFDLPHYITFNLTDKNYKNLPIMKGEIILWPRHM